MPRPSSNDTSPTRHTPLTRRTPTWRRVCDLVNVGFFLGAHLPDPHALLQGTASSCATSSSAPGHDVDNAALEQLVTTAYTDMKHRVTLTRRSK